MQLTFDATLDSLCAYGRLFRADEEFGLLLPDELPERWVYLTSEVRNGINMLTRSPGEEDPDVPSRGQVLELMARFVRGEVMRHGRDYQHWDRRNGIWKWKTRTTRMAGMYLSRHQFVMVRIGFARGLKRGGIAVTEAERAFAQAALAALVDIGLDRLDWLKEDPHRV